MAALSQADYHFRNGRLAMRFIVFSILLASGSPAFAVDPKPSVAVALVNLKSEFQKKGRREELI